jgi:F0F1-type ATP synthase assembly protein I
MALEPQDPSDPKKQNPYSSYLKYSSLAIQLVVVIGVFGWLGHLLDGYFNLRFPVFLLTLVMIAFAGMMYQLYKSLDKS